MLLLLPFPTPNRNLQIMLGTSSVRIYFKLFYDVAEYSNTQEIWHTLHITL